MQGLPLHVSLYETLFRITNHRVELTKPLPLSARPCLYNRDAGRGTPLYLLALIRVRYPTAA
jgi:hypothetical protein